MHAVTSPNPVDAGQTAPDFTLSDQDGEPFTLSSLRGRKAIVYFYAEAFTPACTAQTCDFRDSMQVFQDAGYAVVGISRDSVATLAKFAAEEHLPFPVLSDPDRRVHDLYDAFGEKNLYGKLVNGVLRCTFVLDENGVVTLALRNIKATGHVAMLKRKLGLQAAA
jgi:peroxiredoxin Q/BCP